VSRERNDEFAPETAIFLYTSKSLGHCQSDPVVLCGHFVDYKSAIGGVLHVERWRAPVLCGKSFDFLDVIAALFNRHYGVAFGFQLARLCTTDGEIAGSIKTAKQCRLHSAKSTVCEHPRVVA
jgi:hypothetical protein